MCGIAGKMIFGDEKVTQSHIQKMIDTLNHRGPDDQGIMIDRNVGLGFKRLSIIDLDLGHQPLSDQGGNYWITFNGEIYNYRELRKILEKKGYSFSTNSDTEVIVNLYAEFKEKSLEYLRGMFSFVIWDNKHRELFGARDRLGIKPLYYFINSHQFIWGSEIKSLLASDQIERKIDYSSLDYYFAYGYSPRDKTIYSKINKLLPGHYFKINQSNYKLLINSYWSISFDPDYSKSEDYWKDNIYETLEESVKMMMISDVPLGAFLSGGIDSSIVVSLMARNSSQPIKTFSIGFKEEEYNELKFASSISEKYSTEHHEQIIEPESIDVLKKLVSYYDEPFADSSAIPTYYVSKFAKQNVTVVLSGDGGDELFAGYNSYNKMLKLYFSFYNNSFTNKYIFNSMNRIIPDYFWGKGTSYYLSKDKDNIGAYFCLWNDYERKRLFIPEIQRKIELELAEERKIKLIKNRKEEFISRMQFLDLKTYLPDDILTKVDIASMMNSLEARVPLLDHKFVELSAQIPWEFKLKNYDQKYILKQSFKNLLPQSIISHKKQGFTLPLKLWFKDDLKDYAFESLLNWKELNEFFNKEYINSILNYNQKGIRNYSSKIWSLLFFKEWSSQH